VKSPLTPEKNVRNFVRSTQKSVDTGPDLC
jgi:hypothetical protein